MTPSQHIARHFRGLFFGPNATGVHLQALLADVTWEEATARVGNCNTIALLTYHIHYYVRGVLEVLRGGPLVIRDKYSYDLPPLHAEADWKALRDQVWTDAEAFASEVEQLPEERLWQNMADARYGSWYQNLHGIIEHSHYHMGQIALLKKILRNTTGRT
ncbi:MAG: DinB family protein [Saprospiraceae bacterium]|nr:DinB family protein [Saprospiraceae bacterium]